MGNRRRSVTALSRWRRSVSLWMAIMLLFSIILPYSGFVGKASAQAGNLIANGDFESGDLTGWNAGGNSKFKVTNTTVHGATYALEVSGPQDWNGIKYTAAVSPNTDYKLTFYSKGAGGAAYKVLGAGEVTIKDGYTGTQADWQQYSLDFNSGANASVIIYVSDASGIAYYDDFVLVSVNAPAPITNLISNGGFENGDLTGWNAGGNSKFKVTNTTVHGATYSLEVSGPQDWNGIKYTAAVSLNTDYKLTFYSKGAGGAAYKVLGAGEATIKEGYTGTQADWQQYTLNFSSGTNSSVIIFVSDATGTAYYDDFVLESVGSSAPSGPVSPPPPTPVTNLITNGGFENGDLTGWNAGGNSKFKVIATTVHGATYALEVSGPQNWNGIKYTAAVSPNTDYKLTFYGKGAGGAAYKVLGATEATITENYTGTQADWQQYTVTFNSGANASIIIYVSDASGTAYYDDFVLESAAPQQTNLVANGGFETGDLTSWSTAGSTKFTTTGTVKRTGNHALQITSSVQDYQGIKNTVSVKANTAYTLTFYGQGSGGSYYKVLANDANETTIVEAQTVNSGSTWNKYSINFNSGSNSSVIIYLSDMVGTAYFDDFEIAAPMAPKAPEANSVALSGDPKVTKTLTGSYAYSSPSSVTEGYSIYTWLQADTANGDYTRVKGVISNTLVLTPALAGKFVKFSVTPLDSEGNVGTAVSSDAVGPIAAASKLDELNYQISLAEKELSISVKGSGIGQYPETVWNALDQSITTAKQAAGNFASTDSELMNQKAALIQAMNTFDQGRNKKASALSNFITVNGDKLMDGSSEFRFISFNYPGALFNEDEAQGLMPTAFEQEDAIRSVKQAGGKVFRTYTLTVKKPEHPADVVRHITGPGVLNEEAFQSMDKLLELANKHGVRVIIPFIDHWGWPPGGISDFAAFRGMKDLDLKNKKFYTDPQLMDDFKVTMDKVLNRVNSLTGVRYKDDPAILAWEPGNELMVVPAWEAEFAAHYKSINTKQLLLAGNLIEFPPSGSHVYKNITTEALNNPNFDIVKSHYYSGNYATRVQEDKAKAAGKKPFLVGEFGFKPTNEIGSMLTQVISTGTSGAMVWSIRPHSNNGGFIRHDEYAVDGILYRAYHWPGMPSGDYQDATNLLRLIHEKAYAIDGLIAPPIPKPEPAPELFTTNSISKMKWKGSTGASSYTVERAESVNGPWVTVGEGIKDDVNPGENMFSDPSAESGKPYYYRVKGVNTTGESDYSNVIGPVEAKYVIEDTLQDQSKQYYFDNESIVYRAPSQILAFAVDAAVASGKIGDFTFFVSADGVQFTQVTPDKSGNTYSFANAGLNVNHLQIKYPNGQKSDGTVTRVIVEYKGDGTLMAPIKPLLGTGILVDEMNDYASMSSRSSNIAFAKDNAALADQDPSRLIRTNVAEAFIQYRSLGDMNSFLLETYQSPQDTGRFTFYSSADGVQYSQTAPEVRVLEGQWAKVNYELASLPAGTKFVKIAYPAAANAAPQISRFQAGVGSATVAFPKAMPSHIVDDGEYYGGESRLVDKAYISESTGGQIRLSLDSAKKSAGNYSLKAAFDTGTYSTATVRKTLGAADRSKFDTLQFWVTPDGAARKLTVKLEAISGQVWTSDVTVDGTNPKYVNLPLYGIPMDQGLTFSLTVHKGNGPASGSLQLDDIRFLQARIIDDYDAYAGNSELLARYNRFNPVGNLNLSLTNSVKESGSSALQINYDFKSDGYAGVITTLPHVDWSQYEAMRLWVQPNQAVLKLTIQVRMGSGEYMEASVDLNGGTEPQLIEIPFDQFNYPSWFGGTGKLNPSHITEFNIYLNQKPSTSTTGTIYVDQVELLDKVVSVVGVGINKSKLNLVAGTSEALTATVYPVNAPNQAVTWSSSNTAVATVDATGKVTAVGAGNATITVTTAEGGKTAEAAIRVTRRSSDDETPVSPGAPANGSQNGTVKDSSVVVQPTLDSAAVLKAEVKTEDLQTAITQAEAAGNDTVVIEVPANTSAQSVNVSFHTDVLKASNEKGINRIAVKSQFATVAMAPDALGGSSGNLELSIAKVDTSTLSANQQAKVGNKPVYDFSIRVNGEQVSKFGSKKSMMIHVPYTTAAGENPNAIVVYYLADDGKLEAIKNGSYDAATGEVTFYTNHFSKYALAVEKITFTDLGSADWAKAAIESLTAKQVINGYSAEQFMPQGTVTRAEFLKMLVGALDLADASAEVSFSDIQAGQWYTGAVATAQKLGIVGGYPDGTFRPNQTITREEMAVMVSKASKLAQLPLAAVTSKVVYQDDAEISGFAAEAVSELQQSGIINGFEDATFKPKNTATRAEAAQIINKILLK